MDSGEDMSRYWERQPKETPKSYQAFQVYRDMGLGTRSTTKVAAELGKCVGLIQRWSYQHDWVARVRAYDDWLEMETKARKAEQDMQRAKDIAERNRKVDEGYVELKELALAKARQMARWPLERKEVEGGTTHIHPARWSFNTLARLMEQLDPDPDKIAFTDPTGHHEFGYESFEEAREKVQAILEKLESDAD